MSPGDTAPWPIWGTESHVWHIALYALFALMQSPLIQMPSCRWASVTRALLPAIFLRGSSEEALRLPWMASSLRRWMDPHLSMLLSTPAFALTGILIGCLASSNQGLRCGPFGFSVRQVHQLIYKKYRLPTI